MAYCCNTWASAPSCHLKLLDKLRKRMCRTVGGSGSEKLKKIPSFFPCNPVIRECFWKKTLIDKKTLWLLLPYKKKKHLKKRKFFECQNDIITRWKLKITQDVSPFYTLCWSCSFNFHFQQKFSRVEKLGNNQLSIINNLLKMLKYLDIGSLSWLCSRILS